MMQTLRNNMRHILTIVLLAFLATIVFSWGMGGFKDRQTVAQQGIIGSINGQKIQYQQFALTLEEQIAAQKEESGQDAIEDYQVNMIRDRVWDEMVRDVLLSQEVKSMNIQIAPDEIVFYMRNSPPEFIRSNEQFQTDGNFDMTKYQEALTNPAYYDAWIPLENYYRSVLPLQKLQQWVVSTAIVTDGEVLEAFKQETERVNVRYIAVKPSDISSDNIQVTDSEIKNYYTKNRNTFIEPEKRNIRYIAFDLQPSAEDTLRIHEDISYILEEIQNDADFEEMAREYSQDGSAESGGDLGFFGPGSMVKPFEDAAFSAKVGSVVGPVETQFGLHLIKVLARKREKGETQVHAQHILLKFEIGPDTREKLWDDAQYFSESVETKGFDSFQQIAQEEGYTVEESTAFQEGSFIPGLGMSGRASYLVFKEQPDWVSRPLRINERIVIFQISDIEKEHIKSLEDVKSQITSTLETEKRKAKAGERCNKISDQLISGLTFDQMATSDTVSVQETGLFTIKGYVPGVGQDPKFIGTAFRLSMNEVSSPIEGKSAYYILQVFDKTSFNAENVSSQIDSKKQELLQQKQGLLYSAWYTQLKDNADIQDFRNDFF
ncbi:peptidylprolyl isomerase [candidate division KSB1 bacterium]|nr:peptidylprolyl isomerase [candidate division KSB1 bacterium]